MYNSIVSVSCDSPLYIRSHSKVVLNKAIRSDTKFLADNSVMDYSLLVGLEPSSGELVLGIIGMSLFFLLYTNIYTYIHTHTNFTFFIKNLLIIAIVSDYIRTFTWDKKLETMVKKSGILGGQGKLPTIISPEEYRARFIAAMHRYFLPVPDRWSDLGKGVETI